MSAYATLATAVAVSLSVVACAAPRTGYTLRVTVAPDANERTPVPVDVVFVWDKAALGTVAQLTAADWFASKAQFRRDDPQQKLLTICEWEWVPGQLVPEINLAVPAAARRWAYDVLIFTKYRSPGPHRSRLTAGSAAVLDLRRDTATLRTTGRSTAASYSWIDEVCSAPVSDRSPS